MRSLKNACNIDNKAKNDKVLYYTDKNTEY